MPGHKYREETILPQELSVVKFVPYHSFGPVKFRQNLARAATEAAVSDAKHKRYGVAL